MNQYLELDARLAQLLGYSDIEIYERGMHKWVTAFKPDAQDRDSWNRVTVPAWVTAGSLCNSVADNGAIVNLIAQYEVGLRWHQFSVIATCWDADVNSATTEEHFERHPDKQTTMRVAVAKAVIALLEHKEAT